jgi:protein-L-isoaspartate O-methyltransferase
VDELCGGRVLERRLNKTLSVFEYGSGYSTLFYARCARSVISVEYDQAWYSEHRPSLAAERQLAIRAK